MLSRSCAPLQRRAAPRSPVRQARRPGRRDPASQDVTARPALSASPRHGPISRVQRQRRRAARARARRPAGTAGLRRPVAGAGAGPAAPANHRPWRAPRQTAGPRTARPRGPSSMRSPAATATPHPGRPGPRLPARADSARRGRRARGPPRISPRRACAPARQPRRAGRPESTRPRPRREELDRIVGEWPRLAPGRSRDGLRRGAQGQHGRMAAAVQIDDAKALVPGVAGEQADGAEAEAAFQVAGSCWTVRTESSKADPRASAAGLAQCKAPLCTPTRARRQSPRPTCAATSGPSRTSTVAA